MNNNNRFLLLLVSFLLFSTSISAENHTTEAVLDCLIHHPLISSSISDVIYTPENPSFSSVLQAYVQYSQFLSLLSPKPLAIVTALDISHVQATITCVKRHALELRIRSGGHDFEGLSYRSKFPFILLDLFNLNNININIAHETAWVQTGATLGELYYGIAKVSKTHGFPAGYWSTVGAGGHISGGGYGELLRKYGLAADQVVDAIFVDAKGQVFDRRSMGEDVFWAIRGSGGGNFGVVVAWKVKLVPVPEKVTVFSVQKTLEEEQTTSLVYKWQTVAPTLVDDLCLALGIFTVNSSQTGQKTVMFTFEGQFLGGADDLVSVMQENFSELGFRRTNCREMSWIESVLFFGGFEGYQPEILLNRTAPARFYAKGLSDYVTSPIPVEGLEGLWEYLLSIDVGSVLMMWHPYGGKMAEIPPTATPYPHRRGNLYMMFNAVSWDGEKVGAVSTKHIEWIYGMYEYLKPYVSKNPRSAYVNYRDLKLGVNKMGDIKGNYEKARIGWGNQYYKDNFDRLVKVKANVDPENFFRFEQSIPIPPLRDEL